MASRGERKMTGLPWTRISPSSGRYSPASTFISVLLPAPFSPSSAWTSPGRRSKLTRSLARTPGNRLTTPRISTALGRPGELTRLLGQLALDALGPPLHAVLALQALGAGGELVEVGLGHLLAGRHDHLAGVVLDRPGEHIKAGELA